MALTPKQAIFVKEYLKDKNATRSAKAAGYSKKTAHSAGPRLLGNVEIKAEIAAGLEALAKEAEARARKVVGAKAITKERWLAELALIAFANMDDYATVGSRGVSITHTKDRPRKLGRAVKKLYESTSLNGGSQGIELHPKLPALEQIAKHYGWIKDKVEHSGEGGGPVQAAVIVVPSNGREVKDGKSGNGES